MEMEQTEEGETIEGEEQGRKSPTEQLEDTKSQTGALMEEVDTEEVDLEETCTDELGTETGTEEMSTRQTSLEDQRLQSPLSAWSVKSSDARSDAIESATTAETDIGEHSKSTVTNPNEEAVPEVMQEEKKYDRWALLEKYNCVMAARESIVKRNIKAQQGIVLYLRKKKTDGRELSRHPYDQDQRYIKFMVQVDELCQEKQEEMEAYQSQFEEMQQHCDSQRQIVDLEHLDLLELKKQVALSSTYSRTGRPISALDIEQFIATHNKKEAEVTVVRLENIKLKYKILKKEQQLRTKEELGKGLHLIDFEQLKVENQTLNEKIEERNEELRKLHRKISSSVHVLTHLKEKLQFVKGENHIQTDRLREVEGRLSQKRDILTHMKQARDMLRIDNTRLRQTSGLLGQNALLRDFEDRQTESMELHARLDQLHAQYTELTLACKQMRKKIEWARHS